MMEKQIAALATDEEHVVMWDIDSLLAELETTSSVPVATLKLIPKKWLTIDKTYSKATDPSKPIVLFEITDNKVYVADGNHRLYRAATEGIPMMNVVLVPEKTHLKYLFHSSVEDYYEVIKGLMSESVFIDCPF